MQADQACRTDSARAPRRGSRAGDWDFFGLGLRIWGDSGLRVWVQDSEFRVLGLMWRPE